MRCDFNAGSTVPSSSGAASAADVRACDSQGITRRRSGSADGARDDAAGAAARTGHPH